MSGVVIGVEATLGAFVVVEQAAQLHAVAFKTELDDAEADANMEKKAKADRYASHAEFQRAQKLGYTTATELKAYDLTQEAERQATEQRLRVEREIAALKLAEEHRVAVEKAAVERKLAEEKAAVERRKAEETAAEEWRRAEEIAAEQQRRAQESAAEEEKLAIARDAEEKNSRKLTCMQPLRRTFGEISIRVD